MTKRWLLLTILLCLTIPWLHIPNGSLPTGRLATAVAPAATAGAVGESQGEVAQQFWPERLVKAGNTLWYGLSGEKGFLVSQDQGVTWESRNEGLPQRLVYPAFNPLLRRLTALAVDPVNPKRVAVTTCTGLYLSEDAGMTWRFVPLDTVLAKGAYITAVALSSHDPQKIMIGTAYSGIFETVNAGKSWTEISTGMSFLFQGFRFWEEISALTYHPVEPDCYYFACDFGNGLYFVKRGKKEEVKKLELPEVSGELINGLYFSPLVAAADGQQQTGTKEWALYLTGIGKTWIYQEEQNQIRPTQPVTFVPELEPDRAQRLRIAADRFGIYVRPNQARGKLLDKHIQFIKVNGLNAMVVDFKDDSGYITYASGLSLPQKVGAVRKLVDLPDLLKKAKENGIYVIGRLVVFKDPKLYEFADHKYAVWDRTTDRPWGHLVETTDPKTKAKTMVQREFWVDPFSPEVWEYNLAIAEELAALGVDEIQFDYIRFPTDGAIANIKYRYQTPGMEKSDALESFLALARKRLTVPISTDLYGFNCWYRMEELTGQNIEMVADYVDVVAPMFYPSHFPKGFLNDQDYLARAKRLYYEGTRRAKAITGGKCLIRPYVQAFLLGGERRMKEAAYTKYLTNQIVGVLTAPGSGFTLWNNSNDYYMVKKPIFPSAQSQPQGSAPSGAGTKEELPQASRETGGKQEEQPSTGKP